MDRLPASSPAHFDAHCSRASGSFKLVLGICVSLALLTWLVFGQTLRHDFVNYDDSEYVYANPEVTKGLTLHGIGWAFSHVHADNWHPLTSMSHMLDCQLYGLKAGGHHCTNVVLHMLGVILLFLVLFEMTAALWRGAVCDSSAACGISGLGVGTKRCLKRGLFHADAGCICAVCAQTLTCELTAGGFAVRVRADVKANAGDPPLRAAAA